MSERAKKQKKALPGDSTTSPGGESRLRQHHSGKPDASPLAAPPVVHEVLGEAGQPLHAETRALMESRFGHDFSKVRVHADGKAAESAQAVNALAYTVGSDIVLGTGQYAPETNEGRKLMAHELTHVVQQKTAPKKTAKANLILAEGNDVFEHEAEQAAQSSTTLDSTQHVTVTEKNNQEIGIRISPTPSGRLQRQLVTPLGQGGGFHGLMERDRQATRGTEGSKSGMSISEAIQGGWRLVRELDEKVLRTATIPQRLTMLSELIQAYWTGSKEEEAIIRILSTTTLSQASELVKQLSEQTVNGKPYLDELDRVVDFGNNLELHNVLSELRLKAMGPEKGIKALQAAPILPWHDVMGFFEDAAVFSFSRTANGKIRIKYPALLFGSKDFANELEKLPTDIFISGHDYEPDQVLMIHDYDKGRFVPVVAQELIGYQHAGVRGFLGHVATVASFAIPGGVAKSAIGKVALFTLERLLPAIFLLIDENRLNLVKWFPNWGPKMIYYSDLSQKALAIYGIVRFTFSGWRILQSWKKIRDSRKLLEGANVNISADAEKVAAAIEKQADDIFAQAEKIHNSEGATSQAAASESGTSASKTLTEEKPVVSTEEKSPIASKTEPSSEVPEVEEIEAGTQNKTNVKTSKAKSQGKGTGKKGKPIETKVAIEAGTTAEKVWGDVLVKTQKNTTKYTLSFTDPISSQPKTVTVIPDFMPTAEKDALGRFVSAKKTSEALLIADSKYIWDEAKNVALDDQIRGMLVLAKRNNVPFVFLLKEGGGISKGVRDFADKIGVTISIFNDTSGLIR